MANDYFDFLEKNSENKAQDNNGGMVNLTLRADAECQVVCDGEFLSLLVPNQITKGQAPAGQHILQFISTESPEIIVEKVVDFPDAGRNYLVLVNEFKNLINDRKNIIAEEDKEGSMPFVAKLGGKGLYTGRIRHGKPDGKGKVVFESGGYYEGDFKDGWRHGMGYFRLSNGDIYEGEFLEDMRTGKGKLTTPDGRIWEGEFLDGQCHGKIKCTFANGNTLEGIWIKGDIANQPNIYTWTNGDRLECSGWDLGSTGKGLFTYADGHSEEQEWKNGKKVLSIPYEVQTFRFNPGGSYLKGTYKGQTLNGVPDGQGVFTCDLFTYEGEFKSFFYSGTLPSGTYHEEWNGFMHGKGTLKWKNGDKFEGMFFKDHIDDSEGIPHKYYWADGDRVEGTKWQGGTCGDCQLITKDGLSFHLDGGTYIWIKWKSYADAKKYVDKHSKPIEGKPNDRMLIQEWY